MKPFVVGWQEWVSLPELGLPAIKAKIDTGARSSALHAFLIEPFGAVDQPMVRFGIHPIPGRVDVEIYCSAPIIDRREVTSSNGDKEIRYFIRTALEMGPLAWPIEIGLTNRESMTYRMLLGRQAIRDDMMVDPAASFRQPRLSYRLYRHLPPIEPVPRPLRIAVVGRGETSASIERLAAAAGARGHVLERLDLERLDLTFGPEGPGLTFDRRPLAHYDAVVPRVGTADGPQGAAAIRQLELMGSYAVNPGDALDRRANRIAIVQALARAGVAHKLKLPAAGRVAAMRENGTKHHAVPPASETMLRVLVAGGSALAVMRHHGDKDIDAGVKRLRPECRLAEKAAVALDLGLAVIDIDVADGQPHVTGLSSKPPLRRFEKVSGVRVAEAIIALIESRVGR